MMIVNTINKIIELAGIQQIERGKDIFTLRGLKRLKSPDEQTPEVLELHTLTGMVDYVQKRIDGKVHAPSENALVRTFIQVMNPSTVVLVSELQPTNDNERWGLACSSLLYNQFQFGHYYCLEDFIVGLRSLMVPTEEVDGLINMLGHVALERVKTLEDNGFAQQLNLRIGIRLSQDVEIKNPINLQPYRTFPEVPQPASLFVLRCREEKARGPEDKYKMSCALFEADGGAWKVEAIEAIKKYFAEKLPIMRVIG
jgi:hypothetical protein